MSVKLAITDPSRKYGYIYWNIKDDARVVAFFEQRETVDVVFCGVPIGQKNVDFKYRRVSVGVGKIKLLPDEAATYTLEFGEAGRLHVSWQ